MRELAKLTVNSLSDMWKLRFSSAGLAAIITVMVVAQLFTFEKFPDVIGQLLQTDDEVLINALAAVVVIVEVTAIPFLLFMPLSPAMRLLSMISGWLTIAIWIGFITFGSVKASEAINSGVLGATLSVPVGLWMLPILVIFGIWAGMISYRVFPRTVR